MAGARQPYACAGCLACVAGSLLATLRPASRGACSTQLAACKTLERLPGATSATSPLGRGGVPQDRAQKPVG